VLKRFSGGGTVIVDHNTIFTTFICNVVRELSLDEQGGEPADQPAYFDASVLDQDSFPHVKPYPREIMAWSISFFEPFFARVCGAEKVCGGTLSPS
jgi:hypothetical protein